MTVESVGATALGVPSPGAIRKVLLAGSLTVATGVALVLPTPAANARTIEGTERDDHIVGTAQFDRIHALGGDDVVWARGGFDDVFGGRGNDTIRGGPTRDHWLGGGAGNDTIFGGGGADATLDDGYGDDELRGGPGHDQIQTTAGDDSAYGGRGPDLITLNQWFPVRLSGSDSVHGGPGNDFFQVEPDGSPDLIDCGPGKDTVGFNLDREALDELIDCEVVELS
jgi:Ca2+-binding RTX toxin-like protein